MISVQNARYHATEVEGGWFDACKTGLDFISCLHDGPDVVLDGTDLGKLDGERICTRLQSARNAHGYDLSSVYLLGLL